MPLDHVDADVLLQIFTLVDVFTILSLSRVNKAFHSIASAKQLWLAIVRDLSWRGLLDPPEDSILATLSTTALKEEVRRVVVGPRTWSGSSTAPPTLSRQITFSIGDLGTSGSETKFLPGGRHVLIYPERGASPFPDGVECWEVHGGRRVWGWSSPGYRVYRATFDIRCGGSEAAVVLRVTCAGPDHLIALEADLKTGESRDILNLPVGPWFATDVAISGDFFACAFALRLTLLLVNWRTAEFILFSSPDHPRTTVACKMPTSIHHTRTAPGYFVVADPKRGTDGSTADELRIYAIASFEYLWRSVNNLSLDHHMDLTGMPSTTIALPASHLKAELGYHYLQLSVGQSPVHDSTYELDVNLQVSSPAPRDRSHSLHEYKTDSPIPMWAVRRRSRGTTSACRPDRRQSRG
ncbi:hypothetical protein B0H17DRAFT_1149212 [Mycena rosella]|uniref:F-box domain-containing protein n=1 Tax=Mycena rosella TaxID=1033263 RepID=A0AAD7C579_MYCRO|nr:hypothetical protein B0H17DRAFT_1149212 [Mycena rosella]